MTQWVCEAGWQGDRANEQGWYGSWGAALQMQGQQNLSGVSGVSWGKSLKKKTHCQNNKLSHNYSTGKVQHLCSGWSVWGGTPPASWSSWHNALVTSKGIFLISRDSCSSNAPTCSAIRKLNLWKSKVLWKIKDLCSVTLSWFYKKATMWFM